MPRPVDVIAQAERAQVLLHPLRLQLMELLDEPASAAGLAQRLDQPRQRINYHLRELENHGLLERVEEIRRGSIVERTYRRTSRSYTISPGALGGLGTRTAPGEDRYSCPYQIALASRAVEELGSLQASGATLAGETFSLDVSLRFGRPEDRALFAEELADLVAGLILRHCDRRAPEGADYRLYLGSYPQPGAGR